MIAIHSINHIKTDKGWTEQQTKETGYHGKRSSQFSPLKSPIFRVKSSNLHSSGLVRLASQSSVFKKGNFSSLLSSHLRFLLSYNLPSSQGLIFKLPENLVTPPLISLSIKMWQYYLALLLPVFCTSNRGERGSTWASGATTASILNPSHYFDTWLGLDTDLVSVLRQLVRFT